MKIKRGQLPDKEILETLYLSELKTLNEVASYFETSKPRVSKWLETFGIPVRPRGGGNNRKFENTITKKDLKKYISKKLTINQISKIYNCGERTVFNYLKKFGIRRRYNKTEFQEYSGKVRRLTEKEYAKHFDQINPNKHPRTICGTPGGFQLDHIIGIRECFDNNISIKECSSYKNLQIISWEENLNKRVK